MSMLSQLPYECKHLSTSIKIDRLDISFLKRQAKALNPENCNNSATLQSQLRLGNQNRYNRPIFNGSRDRLRPWNIQNNCPESQLDDGNWNCVECGTTLSPWLCLYCGVIHCGRYVNQDGLRHFNNYPEHSLCMDCHNFSVFCYSCDDFVHPCSENEEKQIEALRSSLRFHNSVRESDHSYFNPSLTLPSSVRPNKRVMMLNAANAHSIQLHTHIHHQNTHHYGAQQQQAQRAVQLAHQHTVPSGVVRARQSSASPMMRAHTNSMVAMGGVPAPRKTATAVSMGRTLSQAHHTKTHMVKTELKAEYKSASRQAVTAATRTVVYPASPSPHTMDPSSPPPVKRIKLDRKTPAVLPPKTEMKAEKMHSKGLSNGAVKGGSSESGQLMQKNGIRTVQPTLVQDNTSSNVHKLKGLRNLGNTCFMNCILQALKNIDGFREFFGKLPEVSLPHLNGTQKNVSVYKTRRSGGTDDVCLSEEVRKTVQALTSSGGTSISPDSLFSVVWKLVPRFRGFQQQDAHEFLRCVLDRLNGELKDIRCTASGATANGVINGSSSGGGSGVSAETVVSGIFEGILQSEVTCLICGHSSRKQDPFMDLSLDIPLSKASKNAGNLLSLFDCLDSFFDKEKLDSSERYMCQSCRQKQPSTKQFFVRKLPNVLCLHLKRFRWSHNRQKLDGFVQFPVNGLDGRPFLLRNIPKTRGSQPQCTEFDLAAIVVHHGSGVSSGHYTTYSRRDDLWYHLNDATVRQCSEETVAQQKAYILFYTRRQQVSQLPYKQTANTATSALN